VDLGQVGSRRVTAPVCADEVCMSSLRAKASAIVAILERIAAPPWVGSPARRQS
jgi:hypothetical protein